MDDPFSNAAMGAGPRCRSRVPEVLCGGLRGDDRPRCSRRLPADDTPHGGKCRARRGLTGVGSTEWKWKAGAEMPYKVSHKPPAGVIMGREPIGARIKRYEGNACRCVGLRHEAPCDFAGLLITREK